MQTESVGEQLGLFDQDSWCGRMFQEPLVQTKEKTSKPSSQRSSGSQTQTLPMCLCLTRGDGQSQDAYTMRWADGQLLGDYTMHSFGEQPNGLMTECSLGEHHNGVSVSLLSQILVDSAPPKYSLSAKACVGILNRASRRGKELPAELKEALERQANEEDDKLHPED